MKVLIVGAGAVGQVYARHLQKAGVTVSFLVRPKYVDEVKRGLTLYQLTSRTVREPLSLFVTDVLSTWDEVKARKYDQVWITLPTDALTDAWMDDLARSTGEATIVSLSPGLRAQEVMRARFPDERLVFGLIGLIAYKAPLPGETVPTPGIAYLAPPLAPSSFGGKDAKRAAEALSKGGCPATVKDDVATELALGSALLMPQMVGLEKSGWSLARFRREDLDLATRAGKEARAAVAKKLGKEPGLLDKLMCAPIFSTVWWLAPHVLPLDLEVYLAAHFSKVHDQSVLMLKEYLKLADELGVEAPALRELATFVGA